MSCTTDSGWGLVCAGGIVLLLATAVTAAGPQTGGGRGMAGGMMQDASHEADMRVFHELFDHRDQITRTVTRRTDGVETVTESRDAAVADLLRTHVAAMSARVKEARPIHRRDPLFRELFVNANRIDMRYVSTPQGIRVIETSADAYVVKLIQAHADVVSAFIANGRAEMMKDHPLPVRDK